MGDTIAGGNSKNQGIPKWKMFRFRWKIKKLAEPTEEVSKGLHGISTRDYKKVTSHLAESFGLSSSQVSGSL
ncbi:MAG: hypothetical protein IPJ66_18940 [Bacteroidetes bacterium]|nr:hypothetical protein [Bacteroidota bacterium]